MRLIVFFLLGVVASRRTREGASDHGDISPGARADQTTDSHARESAKNSADAAVVIGLHLRHGDLLDFTRADFHLAGATTSSIDGGAGAKHKTYEGDR
ncbi:hypothetical protein D9M73_273240 [compost metagenome]